MPPALSKKYRDRELQAQAPAPSAPMSVAQEQPERYTQGDVDSSTSSSVLLSANHRRLGATIYNNSTSRLFVKLGAAASLLSFNVVLAPLTNGIGGYYELPYGYTGPVAGVWETADGNAYLVELV